MNKMMIALISSAAVLAAGAANATTVNFSFTNVVGNVAGTVTGHIDGLVDNATSSATGVWVDSYPAGLVLFGSYNTPFNALAWAGTVNENSFTLVNGQVTAAFFSIVNANGVNDQLYLNSACNCSFGTGHTNFLNIGNNDSRYVWNVGNLGARDGLIFSQGNGVPEPATWALMIAGFGLAGAALRRRTVAA